MSAPILPSAFSAACAASAGQSLAHRGAMIGFVAGTRIATPMGYVAVERLSSGDLVLTADGRHARLTSVALHHVEGVTRDTAPVRFAFPLDALQFLLPDLYPEAATSADLF